MPQTSYAPGYWMNETSGVLRPAVEAYLRGDPMSPEQVTAMRAYLRQWIFAPIWAEHFDLVKLRDGINALTTREAIAQWLADAEPLGIDPL